jgi:hypothetical protein
MNLLKQQNADILISPLVLGIILPPLKYGFPRHISSITPLVALIRDKKPWCFAWGKNT